MPALPIILYEGAEDHAFLSQLLDAAGLQEEFVFHLNNRTKQPDCAGKDGFGRILKGLIGETHTAIIIVADNDGDPDAQFKCVQNQIGAAGFTIPKSPRDIVQTPNLPMLSVLMIPWDKDRGCLETLCLSAINEEYKHQLEVCADALVKCAGKDWDIAKQSKLRMRGFLSAVCKSDPNTGLRYAWSRTEKPFPLDKAAYAQIVDFFRNFLTAIGAAQI
jgi:hypothetical protein